MGTFAFRSASHADLQYIKQIAADIFGQDTDFDELGDAFAYGYCRVVEHHADADEESDVMSMLTARGQLIGFGIFEIDDEHPDVDRTGHLRILCVHPYWQGTRVGTHLHRTILEDMRARGCHRGELHLINEHPTRARSFFVRQAWTPVGGGTWWINLDEWAWNQAQSQDR